MREPTEDTAAEMHDLEYYREEERREQGEEFEIGDFIDDKDTLEMEWDEDRAQDEWDKEMGR